MTSVAIYADMDDGVEMWSYPKLNTGGIGEAQFTCTLSNIPVPIEIPPPGVMATGAIFK